MGSLDRRFRKRQQQPQTLNGLRAALWNFRSHISHLTDYNPQKRRGSVVMMDKSVIYPYMDFCEKLRTGSLTWDAIVQKLIVV